MTETVPDLRGPIDFVLIEFEGDKLTGLGADALLDLVQQGIVSVYDVQVIGKSADGGVYRIAMQDNAAQLGDFARMAWSSTGLLDDGDMQQAGAAMEPGTLAVLVVYENTWSIPFITAAWQSGGRLIASARLSAEDVTTALDAAELELTSTRGE